MNLIINNLRIPIEQDGVAAYIKSASEKMGLAGKDLSIVKILSKDLIIKDTNQFFYRITLVVGVEDNQHLSQQNFQIYKEPIREIRKTKKYPDRPVIVGFGPAGMFAALELIDAGCKPRIFERGKNIAERTADVQHFIRTRQLNPESNIQFGEGGAGSYSDGKLFSRRNNNTSYVNRVLKTFVKFGAPHEIEYISKPHLGTDVLCKIVRKMRAYILERGGEILYNSQMTDLLLSGKRATGIMINGTDEYLSENIYIALGHSARDTFSMLHKRGVSLEQRPISVGVRIEHPIELINEMRYGDKYKNFPGLGAATYSLNYTNKKLKKGVYTFCMCPGGEIVNASSSQGMLVLNGMSYSRRNSPFSNAALAVTCHTADYPSAEPLAGIGFQEDIERKTFKTGGGNWAVPAQNLMDFLAGRSSSSLNENSYKMGSVPAELEAIFPGFIIEQLRAAFTHWQKQVPLFLSDQAVLLAAETRTSSPVRITRNERYESVNIKNLYPIGEGSGYTGGITSSAADALRAVDIHLLHR